MVRRVHFILLGTLAGLAFWLLSDLPLELRQSRAFLAVAVLSLSFFGGALAMLGELGLRRALLSAAVIAVPLAGLSALKSLGFTDVGQMLDSSHVPVALAVAGLLPVPFAIAIGLGGRAGWSNYRVLFLESWNIVVRYAGAWLFVAVVWLVLWLLAALLDLVGIDALSVLLGRAPVVWILSGAVLGLALAVVTEMSDMVSPYLLLRLLRLLLPLVLLVEIVFVAVLPLRGLAHLFGQFSVVGILISTALASISLVTIAVDQDDEEAVHGPLLAWAGRGLALLLSVLAVLVIWGLVLRVREYGWTPVRVTGAALAAVIAGYALCYAGAVLSGRGWMRRIRRANVAMALATLALAVLWLTPLISPEAISARAQLGRFAEGKIAVEQLPLWEMSHDWGLPGQRALASLRAQAAEPGQELLADWLAQLDRAENRWDFERYARPDVAGRAVALRDAITVLPAGETMPTALLNEIARLGADDWAAGCATRTPAGHPGCVLVIDDFVPARPGREALLLRLDGVLALHETGESWRSARAVWLGDGVPPDGAAMIDSLYAAGGAPVATELRALPLGSQQLTVLP
ncbi:DUF4153 domain-containing protein [Sinirhodobacter huangdaonensis]|nr:DUF4153 domain-containing protein [Sinirhodobacter huangdaonensis]